MRFNRVLPISAAIVLAACHAGAPALESPSDASTVSDASVNDATLDTGGGASDGSTGAGDGAAASDGTATDSADDSPGEDAGVDAALPLPALPLQATSRWIVDANGKRFKLASVNWYGAEEEDFVVAGLDFQDVHAIARMIRTLGFNSVRLPFSNQLVESNPVVADARLAANPSLQGETALEVLDAVIAALAEQGLVVILDDHMSNANWCCSATDGNGLWYNDAYPESSWLADWTTMATRYLSQPAVVGVDLRNELRPSDAGTPTWGGSDPTLDWHGAAERGGNAVLGVNPSLLVIVEGLNYSNDLTGVYSLPVDLPVANRLVYSPHDYEFDHPAGISASDLATDLGDEWGYILVQGETYTAPIWVGEFGTCNTSDACVSGTSDQGGWFSGFEAYLANADIDWSYWAFNGTEASGTGRTLGAPETYGVLDPTWDASASAALTSALQSLQPATQGP
ncbi:MAG: glycoside hydrolase family 5 protein [Polyangiaceae bacterium]